MNTYPIHARPVIIPAAPATPTEALILSGSTPGTADGIRTPSRTIITTQTAADTASVIIRRLLALSRLSMDVRSTISRERSFSVRIDKSILLKERLQPAFPAVDELRHLLFALVHDPSGVSVAHILKIHEI